MLYKDISTKIKEILAFLLITVCINKYATFKRLCSANRKKMVIPVRTVAKFRPWKNPAEVVSLL